MIPNTRNNNNNNNNNNNSHYNQPKVNKVQNLGIPITINEFGSDVCLNP
jgi:hypothetical protein